MRINLAKIKFSKRYLVSTTDDSEIAPVDPTRFFVHTAPQNRYFGAPVEKVGLARIRAMRFAIPPYFAASLKNVGWVEQSRVLYA